MIAVVDYGIGNLRSAEKALLRVGAAARLVTDPDELCNADAIVLPGVGAYGACAQALSECGFDEVLRAAIAARIPLLGLCVGFQLLFAESEESPGVKGLGVLPGVVRKLSSEMKLPQMQWNTVQVHGTARPAMLEGLSLDPWFYFVHSYAPVIGDLDGDQIALVADYGGPFVAGIEREELWGTQFHPEKSGSSGLGLLANFVRRFDASRP